MIQHFIKLVTVEKLKKQQISSWYKTVKNEAPSGIVSSWQAITSKGPKNLVVIVKQRFKEWDYFIPLTRNLREDEITKIVRKWDENFQDIDFSIETSSEILGEIVPSVAPIPETQIDEFSEQIAKKMHNKWWNEKTKEGWRYGIKFDQRNKTNPMMKSWDDLPKEYRKIDPDLPQMFLDWLDDAGYVVLRQADFDKLAKRALSPKL
jgi:hypothetical protein